MKYRTWLSVNLLIFISEITLQNSSYICCWRCLLNVVGLLLFPSLPCYESFAQIRGDADKFLVRSTSRCRRTESIAMLERGVCSCVELQDLSCYRGWKEACQARRAISTTWRRELSKSFFFSLQGKAPKEIHDIFTETLGEMHHRMPPSKTGWPSLNVVIFPPVMRLVLDDPQRLLTKFTS